MENSDILEGLRNGDTKTIDYIYCNNIDKLGTIIRKNGVKLITQDDLFQDAILVVMENSKKENFKLTCKFSTYFYSICNNIALKSYNQNKRYSSVGDNNYGLEHGEEMKISSLEDNLMNMCLDELPDSRKIILELYYFEGLSNKEIAKKLSMANPDSVKTQKYKAMKALEKIVFGKKLVKENFIND